MPRGDTSRKRCAIYTRKSSEEGLEQEFNSLAAQREACEAFIRSQRDEGWVLAKTRYDDGGFSGGNLERPAAQRLLTGIRAGRIDIVVVYKVDRLTRSLADFARLVELFDAQGVSFVSVTQQFNTTSSMGRLTLNVLLSFAQFEREVTGERIRDKIAASKKKGMWMGGNVPLGYDANERTLVINPAEAETVRRVFALYRELGCVRRVKEEADRLGLRTKCRTTANGAERGGKLLSRGHLYTLLSNPILITHYPQPSRSGTKQEHTAVSAGLNDGAQQGAISKGAQRGPVCCSLRNRGSVPGSGDALALAIRLCLPGLRRAASQLGQDPGALPVCRLSTADIRDRRNDFRGNQGAAVHLVSRHVPPHSEQGRHLQH